MLIYLIVFIEGFCSLGAEIVALRRLVPHVGSSIIVTAPTIGFFLFALAIGYATGGKVVDGHTRRVARNFLLAGLIAGIGLAGPTVDALFLHLQPALLAYLVFMATVLCPIAWLLGQTVPILTNLMKHSHVGQASGMALYWSTLGSFLGAVSLSVWVMQWFGVSAAVFACAGGLILGAILLEHRRWQQWLAPLLATGLVTAANLAPVADADTAYADYRVKALDLPGQIQPRLFMTNRSHSSQVDDSQPPHLHLYIQHMKRTLLDDLGYRDKDILVLGAGGFTLSHGEPLNRYTYVDIDPAIREIAEKHFLKAPINGEFIAQDARLFVATTERRFDAVVVDAYSDRASIPSHLVTQEFWRASRRTLQPGGVLMANLILDTKLASPYARHMLDTLESVYGRCGIEVLHKGQAHANVIAFCRADGQPTPPAVYTDEHNRSDLELLGVPVR
jgi:predicted membrane-bound spermidine synthase